MGFTVEVVLVGKEELYGVMTYDKSRTRTYTGGVLRRGLVKWFSSGVGTGTNGQITRAILSDETITEEIKRKERSYIYLRNFSLRNRLKN